MLNIILLDIYIIFKFDCCIVSLYLTDHLRKILHGSKIISYMIDTCQDE